MKQVAFYTLGCKVNQYETDAMRDLFINAGYEVVDFEGVADVYVINTCTVTAHSDKKSRQIINRAKRSNKKSKIVVTGCMAEEMKQQKNIIDGIDYILGNEERKNIVNIIENDIEYEFCDISNCREFWETGKVVSQERTRAYIKIEDGCNNFCTYCIIPYVRGRVRSRDKENIIEEVKKVLHFGVREIVLIGIHLASYGKDLAGITLVDIIEEINKIDGDFRIRLGSLEPGFIDIQSVERLKKCEKLCKHFHLALQSGMNDTLKRMNRKYTTEEFKEKVELLRVNFEDVAITTDIIVGFPGETDEEFESTYKFLEKINLSKLHVFPYSKRKGTVAEKMEGQVPEEIKNVRAAKLIELSQLQEEEFKHRFIGKNMKVILERREKDGFKLGYNEQYVSVLVHGKAAGDVVEVVGTKENLGIKL